MTKEQAIAMLKAKRECIELDTKGNAELCDRNCGECKLNYEQGNMGEQKEALDMAIKALEQQSIAKERYQDLVEHFGDKPITKYLLENREEFRKWLEWVQWNINMVGELARKLEQQPIDDCVSRQAVLDTLMKCEKPCDDRQEFYLDSTSEFEEEIKELPPVAPTHGTCKDCKHWKDSDGVYRRGISAESKCPLNILQVFDGDFYCADFEKRGGENDKMS